MSNNSLGDFFIKLGITPDKNSFETGNKMIDGVSNALNRLMATARNAAVAMVTTSVITGKLETADIKAAAAIGMKVEALDTWRTALKISGSDANSFISTISTLDTKFKKLSIDGTFDQNLAQSLGRLGLSYGELAEMDADSRTRKIIEAAQAMEDQKKASIIIGDVLGQAGREFYEYMKLSNVSLNQILAKSSGAIFTSGDSKKESMAFNSEYQLLKESLGQISKLFGSEMGGGLVPVLEDLNSWLQQNQSTIKQLASDIGVIAEWAGKKLGKIVEGTGNVAADLITATADVIEGDFTGANNAIGEAGLDFGTAVAAMVNDTSISEAKQNFEERVDLNTVLAKLWGDKYGAHPFLNQLKKLKYEELPEDVRQQVDAQGGKKNFKAYINDGIIKPNGQVVQVAPDDWVLAARDLGSMAAAFIPGAGAAGSSGPVEIAITQNFTVNGSSDIPQVLKQQAYNGTMQGITEMLSKAGVRMQLLPGTM